MKQLKILEQPASLTSIDTDEGGETQTDEGRGTQTDSSISPEVSADFAQLSVAPEKKVKMLFIVLNYYTRLKLVIIINLSYILCKY